MTRTVSIIVAVLFLLYSYSCHAIVLSGEDRAVLNLFFRTLFLESEGGYVYFHAKPVCINGYRFSGNCFPGTERHKQLVIFQEGARVWEQLSPTPKSDYFLHFYKVNDSLAKNYRHFLFIDKNSFLDVVQKELPIFKYVLGPSTTPTSLLQQLIDPNIPFHTTLKNDKVLIGMLLGFGTQNSLLVSRIENLQESFFNQESPPEKPLIQRFGNLTAAIKEQLLLTDSENSSSKKMSSTNFGFNSIQEEIETLSRQIEISSPQLASKKPYLIFGKRRDDASMNEQIELMQKAQEKIPTFVESQSFLPEILSTLIQEDVDLANEEATELAFEKNESRQLSDLVVAELWNLIGDEDDKFQDAFYIGMEERENGKTKKSYRVSWAEYEKCKVWLKIEEKLDQCRIFINNLEKSKDCRVIIPGKLSYKILHQGNSSLTITKGSRALFHCTVFAGPHNALVFDTIRGNIPLEIKISDTIPGFALGVQGMALGEIRELYIHPDYGYGVYTTFDKGQYLKITVQLVEIVSNDTNGKIADSNPFDIEALIPRNLQTLYQKYQYELGYLMGYQMWEHYKDCDHYSLSQLLAGLKIRRRHPNDHKSPDAENASDLMNRLHWNLYVKKSNSSPLTAP